MKKYIVTLSGIFALSLLVSVSTVSAATVYIESSRNTIQVGDTAVITVKINADGAVLNTVEGDVVLKPSSLNLAVQEFSLAHSSFGLWPRTPSLASDLHTISFVGGVPGGFSIEGATLYKIVVDAKKAGTVTVSPQNMSVYANDGKGTKLPVQGKDLTISVVAKGATAVQNDWQSIVATDKVAPEDFIVVAGQDTTLFEGKKFVYFSALDNQSGIDYYDVSEDGAPAVRSGSTYVLKNQTNSVKLDVVAYDKAGNKKSATYSGATGGISWGYIVAIVLLGIIVRYIYKKWKRNKAKNITNVSAPL